MARKAYFQKKKSNDPWSFDNHKTKGKRPLQGFKQDYSASEKIDIDWIRQDAAYKMAVRQQEVDLPNVYGLMESY